METSPLISSQPERLPRDFDAIVVGCGAAGLYSALCLPSSWRVALVTKETLSLSASDWAQGGLASAIAPNDSPQLHAIDTIKAGAGLCDRPAVEFLVQQAPQCVADLVQLGVAFDRHGADLALTLEAAHSRRRVLHAADTTGRAVVSALTERVCERKNIWVLQQALAVDLWQGGDRCQGLMVVYGDSLLWLQAKVTILATGGGGQVFAQTTNPSVSTGDGVAIAWRAGAVVRDLEFFQFHPTALTRPGAPRFLISEAVRGEGAHVVDDTGRRFLFDYDPAGELAPRDKVSRSLFLHLEQQRQRQGDQATPHVWLDLRPIPTATIQRRFPGILQVCQTWGVNALTDPIPVAPAAHYWMGGVRTGLDNATSLPGLYSVGETASTGVHGANRLASNSLLECIVYGAQFRSLTLPDLQPSRPTSRSRSWADLTFDQDAWLAQVRAELPQWVWHSAGICRDAAVLETAIAQVSDWRDQFAQLPLSRAIAALTVDETVTLTATQRGQMSQWSELRNLLDIAYLILRSARYRTESRGGHYRTDYPHTDDAQWQCHTLIQGDRWWTDPVSLDPAPDS